MGLNDILNSCIAKQSEGYMVSFGLSVGIYIPRPIFVPIKLYMHDI
jgi:hypothetical protein